jgi:hypothetical protein
LYVPAGQEVHADDEVLPVFGLYVPAGQEVHADDEVLPVFGLYVPAGHFEQNATTTTLRQILSVDGPVTA